MTRAVLPRRLLLAIVVCIAISCAGLPSASSTEVVPSITGRIVDSGGDPVAGIAVTFSDHAGSSLQGGLEVVTDADGMYAAVGLAPGRYRVHVVPSVSTGLISQFYNGATDFSTANTVVVVAGSTTKLESMSLVAGLGIEALVTDGSGNPSGGGSYRIERTDSAGEGIFGLNGTVSAAGSIAGVLPPGSYRLSVSPGSDNPDVGAATTLLRIVEVNGSELVQVFTGGAWEEASILPVVLPSQVIVGNILLPVGEGGFDSDAGVRISVDSRQDDSTWVAHPVPEVAQNSAGRFGFSLADGHYRAMASAPAGDAGHGDSDHVEFDVSGGSLISVGGVACASELCSLDLRLRPSNLRGSVLSPAGDSGVVSAVRIHASDESGNEVDPCPVGTPCLGHGTGTVQTDISGRFGAAVSDGTFAVSTLVPDSFDEPARQFDSRVVIKIEEGEITTIAGQPCLEACVVEIRLKAVTLSGELFDVDGNDVAGASMTVHGLDAQGLEDVTPIETGRRDSRTSRYWTSPSISPTATPFRYMVRLYPAAGSETALETTFVIGLFTDVGGPKVCLLPDTASFGCAGGISRSLAEPFDFILDSPNVRASFTVDGEPLPVGDSTVAMLEIMNEDGPVPGWEAYAGSYASERGRFRANLEPGRYRITAPAPIRLSAEYGTIRQEIRVTSDSWCTGSDDCGESPSQVIDYPLANFRAIVGIDDVSSASSSISIQRWNGDCVSQPDESISMSSCWSATDLGGDFGPNVSLSLVDDAYLLSVSTDGAFGRMEFSSVVDIVEGLVIPLSGASEGAGTNAGLIVLSPLATVLSGTVLSADGTQPEAVYANLEFLDGIIWLDDPSSALLIRGGEFAIAAPVPVNQAVLYRIDFSFFDVGLQSWSFLSREFRLNVDGTHDFAPYEGITNKLPASEKWIVVPPSSRVSGIARVPDGTPAGGSTFSVERWDSSQQAWDRSGALVGTSDSAGRFAVDLVTPGDYRFRITSPWNGTIGYREIYGHVHVDEDFSFQVCASDRVTCSAASTLDLSFVDPSLRIRLVTQPGGQPVADAWTQIERWNSETNAWEWRDQSSVSGQGRTGFPVTSGDYRIYVQPRTQGVRGGVAFWEYLHVNAESNTTCIADETRACVGPESPGEIEIPLRTSNVTITVNDAGGTPVTGNALIVWSTGGFWTSGYTGPTGEVALHLPDGTYQAEVHPRWGSSSSLPARLRIVVSSGAVGSWGYLSGPAEAETFEQQCSGVPCSVIVGLDRIAPNVSGLVTARSFPAIGAFVIARDSANRVVSRSVSDVVGAFTLSLPPGSIYSITATAVSAGIARSTSVQCDLVAAPECPSLSLALFGDPL